MRPLQQSLQNLPKLQDSSILVSVSKDSFPFEALEVRTAVALGWKQRLSWALNLRPLVPSCPSMPWSTWKVGTAAKISLLQEGDQTGLSGTICLQEAVAFSPDFTPLPDAMVLYNEVSSVLAILASVYNEGDSNMEELCLLYTCDEAPWKAAVFRPLIRLWLTQDDTEGSA